MCSLQTRHPFEKKLRDQVDGVTHELQLSRGIHSLSFKFITFKKAEEMELVVVLNFSLCMSWYFTLQIWS